MRFAKYINGEKEEKPQDEEIPKWPKKKSLKGVKLNDKKWMFMSSEFGGRASGGRNIDKFKQRSE